MSIQVKVVATRITVTVIKEACLMIHVEDRVSENEYIITMCHLADMDYTNKHNNLLRLQTDN